MIVLIFTTEQLHEVSNGKFPAERSKFFSDEPIKKSNSDNKLQKVKNQITIINLLQLFTFCHCKEAMLPLDLDF